MTDELKILLKKSFYAEYSNKSIDEILLWIKYQTENVHVELTQTTFSLLKNWNISDTDFSINHNSGKFFSIIGVNIKNNYHEWDQPIINQPEIGILGIITKKINGVLHFLLQAKIEPGNINFVQLSPTVQATKSNFTKVHKGKSPDYIDFFLNNDNTIIYDQLLSEQGARFLKKRNRNIIIYTDNNIDVKENFIWLTLGQIKKLLEFDNLINMDTRTVLSGVLNFIYEINHDFELNSISQIYNKITSFKFNHDISLNHKNLNNLNNWEFKDDLISHVSKRYFSVIPIDIFIENREVTAWSQPMIMPSNIGLCCFIGKYFNNTLHFAVQLKSECGNLDIVEFAPTIQCELNDSTTNNNHIKYMDVFKSLTKDEFIVDSYQSEEGGRFYKEQNRHVIAISSKLNDELESNFIWISINQIRKLLFYTNMFNIQARSLMSLVPNHD